MKTRVLLLSVAMVGFFLFSFFSIAWAEVSAQKWQYYESVSNQAIEAATAGKVVYIENLSSVISDLLFLVRNSNEKAEKLINDMLSAGVSEVVDKVKFRPGFVSDYKEWLEGFVHRGGKIKKFLPNNSTQWQIENDYLKDFFRVAKADFNLEPGGVGIRGYIIIVPKGVKFIGKPAIDPNFTLLFMDGFRAVGKWPITTWKDTGL